jgi:hypothetical protein
MKLPVQAPAVVRGGLYWLASRPTHRVGAVVGIEPANGGHVVNCTGTTPFACVCDNGIATCCATNSGCTVDSTTGACNCSG